MSNWLKMSQVHAIEELLKNGWSLRRIARELGVHRDTVAKYAKRAEEPSPAKPAISTAGTDEPSPASTPSPSHERRAGRQASCEPLRKIIEEKFALGLTAQRIWQDLRDEHGYPSGYESVKRFVRRLRGTVPLPFRRIETPPGDEAQVDFGQGALTKKPGSSKLRRPHTLRVVLSHSREAFSEA